MDSDIHRLDAAFVFTTSEPSVLIHKNQAEVCIDGNSYTGDGEVRLDLLPRANIYIYGYFGGVPAKAIFDTALGQTTISSFSIGGRRVEGFRVSGGGDVNSEELNIKWSPSAEPIEGIGYESTQMTRIVFHLFNFVDLIGTRSSIEESGKTRRRIEHIDLEYNEWQVELKSLVSTPESIKALREEGGYQLTHIVGIKKIDGTPFSGKDAHECLYLLRFFLSFAKGGWCEPVCAVGLDAFGDRVWESWSSPREPWHSPPSWFDPHNSSQMVRFFPGFAKRWANDDWRKALREVIYWYLNANYSPRGIDAGIILTQAAIERLAYEYAVKDRRLVTVEGFKNLWASDKFRLLFSSLKIPLDLPPETPKLQALASNPQMNWIDAPHALTEVRNSLVHPEHKKRGQVSAAYYEAWNLGLWYLEMGLLAICGFSGTYGNRLKKRWVGQVENVPWNE